MGLPLIRFFLILLAVAVCAGARAQTSRSDQNIVKTKGTAFAHCDPRKTKFTPTIAAGGLSGDRSTLLSYQSYRASNRLVFKTVYGEFDSPSAARAELEYRARFAVRIVVNGWKVDAKGGVVGSRVEAVLPPLRNSNASVFVLMWTWGRYFHEITSDCKEAVLYAERNAHEAN